MNALRPLLPFLRVYRRRLAWGVSMVVGTAWIGLVTPLVIGAAIDALREDITRERLWVYAALLVGVTVAKGFFQYAQRMLLVGVSRDVERDVRDAYFGHLSRLEAGFYQKRETGDLMALATNDLEAVRLICGPAIMYSANTLLTAVGALFFMVRIDVTMTLLVITTVPLVVLITRVLGQRTHQLFGEVQESFSTMSSKVQESLAGARVVRAYAREEEEIAAFEAASRSYVEHNQRLIRWNAAFSPLLQTTIGFGFAIVLGYGGHLILRGTITLGDFVTFQLFLARLGWPMIAIGWVINLATRGAASLRRIQQVLDTEPRIVDRAPLEAVETLRGGVTFDDLTFAYDESEPVLRGLSLDVPPGATVGVVGRTGAGKSTLLSLIPRLIDPPDGALRVDGHDIHRLPLATLRRSIAMVPQETFLFSASIRENVTFGTGDADEEAILDAVQAAGLDRDLEGFPKGLDTVVGERGITLSGGQKQRVALARAILRQPRILLLDDCLSAVDAETEERILRNLRQVFSGRTVFVVSHRISAVRRADVVVVLDDGRIVERGDHEALLAHAGLYADLHRRQQLEQALAAVS